jgi:hypothetical protein
MTLLHWVDGAWSALRYTAASGGIRLLDTARLSEHETAQWCNDNDDGPTRVVVPARAILCRAIPLGRGDEATLDQRLHATATERLSEAAPPHRLAAAMVPASSPEDTRFGAAIAWPERQPVRLPSGIEHVIGVPDVAGLLSLLGTSRSSEPLVWHDGADGSTALVLAGPGHMAIRSTHMADLTEASSIERLIIESAAQADWSLDEARSIAERMPPTSPGKAFLLLPESIQATMSQRIESAPEDTMHFGIALACALATADDLAALSVLRPSLPQHEPTFNERAQDTLSKQSVAVRLAVLFVLLLLFGPMVANGIRYGILRATHGNLDDSVTAAAHVEQRNKLYAQLGNGSIPVTKLLADIASSTPLGIKIDSVKMGAGEPVRVTGDATAFEGASAAELIGAMKSAMQASRVFKNVTVDWGAQSNLGVRSFKVNAIIDAASVRPNYPEDQDFAAWTHQQRRYKLPTTVEGGPDPRRSVAAQWKPGETIAAPSGTSGPSAGTTVSGPSTPSRPGSVPSPDSTSTPPTTPSDLGGKTTTVPRRTNTSDNINRPDRGGRDVSAGDTGSRSVAGDGARSGDLSAEDLGAIPEILTEAQIATLGRAETLAKVKEVSAARNRVTDPDLDKKLHDYWKRLFAHLRTIPREGGT